MSCYSLAGAGRWLLDSGIQENCGGFSRYYQSDNDRNKPVSTEITGYVAAGLIYLFEVTGDNAYLDRAIQTAGFLIFHAWDPELGVFPYEYPSPSPVSRHRAYFFDSGIIVRGLLAVWRHSRQPELLDCATRAAHGMIADFRDGREYRPILDLPAKTAAARAGSWSQVPGCYQLKAALAWWEVAEVTGDKALQDAYLAMLDDALATYAHYLPGAANEYEIMDRLHAASYFLEGMLPQLKRAECAAAYREGIETISCWLRRIAPSFSRSDVYAQLLRARLYGADAIGIDTAAAEEEAEALARFQVSSGNPRVDGGFLFGRRDGILSPHVNPVSTVFALQSLEMWRNFQSRGELPCGKMLI